MFDKEVPQSYVTASQLQRGRGKLNITCTRKCDKEMPQSPHVTNGNIQNDQEISQPHPTHVTKWERLDIIGKRHKPLIIKIARGASTLKAPPIICSRR